MRPMMIPIARARTHASPVGRDQAMRRFTRSTPSVPPEESADDRLAREPCLEVVGLDQCLQVLGDVQQLAADEGPRIAPPMSTRRIAPRGERGQRT
jgi:hypothetical protein